MSKDPKLPAFTPSRAGSRCSSHSASHSASRSSSQSAASDAQPSNCNGNSRAVHVVTVVLILMMAMW